VGSESEQRSIGGEWRDISARMAIRMKLSTSKFNRKML
jgi:hypothetical protein